MKKICFLSLKGGTGKTTTVLNIGENLADFGSKVLLVDLDPSGYLSTAMGLNNKGRKTLADIETGLSLSEIIQPTDFGPDILPSGTDMNFVSSDFWLNEGKFILPELIEELDYDIVLFDCNPSLNIVNLNGLAASDYIVIPTEPEFLALKGLRQMYLNIIDLTYKHGIHAEIKGIVITKVDVRKKMHVDISEQIAKMFNKIIFKARIRSNIDLAKAMAKGKKLNEKYPNSNGSADYLALTQEFIERFALGATDDDL